MAGETSPELEMGYSLRHVSVICIKSTHNVLNAKRMHSCHSFGLGEIGEVPELEPMALHG
jgi:hypothetical protein